MASYKITFLPFDKAATVESDRSLLEAASEADIVINSVCGGDGICGRCKMIVKEGEVVGDATGLLTREEVRNGVVLACQTYAKTDLVVEIPEETRAGERMEVDKNAQRFRAIHPGITGKSFAASPLTSKVFLELVEPTLDSNLADCQRLKHAVAKATGITEMQVGLKVIRQLSRVLRENGFRTTATIGRRQGIAEIMNLEGGDTSDRNFIAVVDIGTTTVVMHLVDAVSMETVDAQACFNGQSVYGREVTARIMAAEKKGLSELQEQVVEDINRLISAVAVRNNVNLKDITAAVCSGNTVMMHFLLALPVGSIRREPYIAASVAPPPIRAAEVGVTINPRGLLYFVPGISGWVGGDLTAGILATGLHERDKVAMLIDVGTNGEIILGNREWLIACSASTGPALEGASVECGMMAETGAVEKVFIEDDELRYKTIGNAEPTGICGSGIIDLVAVMLDLGIIDRGGALVEGSHPGLGSQNGVGRFTFADGVFVTQDDIENVITAKAAVFAAAKIMLDRVDMKVSDLDRVFLAGGFGSYIDRKHAVQIGLLPDLPISRIQYVGNTSLWGAKLAAFSYQAYDELHDIRDRTTYYDLMGTSDYVEQFQRARFLPHTDIGLFPSVGGAGNSRE